MSVFISEILINELKRGNEKAFTTIFVDYFPRLCRFALSYVMDESVAKNIAQDVFVKLWENRKNLNENKSVLAYLLTITRNNCLDHIKHKLVEHRYQEKLAKDQIELELNYYALKRLDFDLSDYNEIEQIVEKTLNSLPPQCQHVFRLSRMNNLSNAEIAEKLAIGIKAVEANITRALSVFRKELKDYLTIIILMNLI